MQDPMVAFSIYSGVTLTHAGQFVDLSQGLDFIKRLLLAFLLGFAVATGVSLLVMPSTSRKDVFKGFMDYSDAIRTVFKTQGAYVEKAKGDPPQASLHASRRASRSIAKPERMAEARGDLQAAVAALIKTHDKLAADLTLAESEIAWGRLTTDDMRSLFALLRSVMLPLSGISMIAVISQRAPHDRPTAELTSESLARWKSFLHDFSHGLENVASLVSVGLQHVVVVLGLAPSRDSARLTLPVTLQTDQDVEKSAETLAPGSSEFATGFKTLLHDVATRHRSSVKELRDQHVQQNNTPSSPTSLEGIETDEEIFKFLFLEHLTGLVCESAHDLVVFADGVHLSSRHDRLISPPRFWLGFFPGMQRVTTVHSRKQQELSELQGEPEHLPATNAFERCGEKLAQFLHVLASDQSAFGFRAAAASFSVAVLAYLRQTQDFFFEQRIIWVGAVNLQALLKYPFVLYNLNLFTDVESGAYRCCHRHEPQQRG
jgi:hypothetical protein